MVMIYVFSMYAPAMAFSNLSSQVRVMEAGLDRYEALQKQELLVEGKKGFPAANSDITFQKVSFGYQHATVLEDVNFTAKAKSITALVGPSGGGKTTIANLIARFWDVQKGSIAIGGVDVWDMQ
ncbi:MAG: ABC transporter ATP-binding protein [Clostridiales bacterium]|nr:ABC transporter ATP-binding protein [Clostridiales bacterium]